jgi:hypothetical protein
MLILRTKQLRSDRRIHQTDRCFRRHASSILEMLATPRFKPFFLCKGMEIQSILKLFELFR